MNNYLKNERYFVMKIRKNLDYQTLEKFFQGVSLAKNKINRIRIPTDPINPNSSETTAKMKSVCGSGKKKCF